jgi:hypothetical protein
MDARMRIPGCVCILLLVALVGCDGFVQARVKVLSTAGEAIPDALIRLERSTDHDLARLTDAKGCAYFSGVVAPVRQVAVSIGKADYESHSLKLRTMQENCLVVHLAQEGGKGNGSIEALALKDCPCDSNSGYSPTLAARFKVSDADGAPLNLVALRRSDRPVNEWSQVTDERGCLGVTWIVSASVDHLPLVLERPDYQPSQLEIRTMGNPCYSVRLARTGADGPSTVVEVSNDKCECEMFSGKTAWPHH